MQITKKEINYPIIPGANFGAQDNRVDVMMAAMFGPGKTVKPGDKKKKQKPRAF